MAKSSRTRVKAIPSTEPAARDEGPRLIPLRNEPEGLATSHYLQLADAALSTPIDKEVRKRKSHQSRKKIAPETLDQS